MKKIVSWLSYIAIGFAIQQVAISHMCQVRGTAEIGGEYLILVGMIVFRMFLEQAIYENRDYEEE